MNIIITGGSRGMGKEMAFEFAKTSSHIILCARNLEHLQKTKTVLRLAQFLFNYSRPAQGGPCFIISDDKI